MLHNIVLRSLLFVITVAVKYRLAQLRYRPHQACTAPWRQLAVVTASSMAAPSICGSAVWNVLHITPSGA